jgi:tryptophan synthase alpha chain
MKPVSRIAKKFSELKEKNEIALIVYITAGYPSLTQSMEIVEELDQRGADIIEIGVPFSDPVADGPIIQYSSQIALDNGVTLKNIIKSLKTINVNKPLVIMSYLNPVLTYGKEAFLKDLKSARISGFIIPDLPVEEANSWRNMSEMYSIDNIFLVAPTSPLERIKKVAEASRGFIYCVSVTGTTGVRNRLSEELAAFLDQVRQLTDKPLAVGFGISKTAHIKSLRDTADGIIIGSRIIDAIKKGEDIGGMIKEFKVATRR